MTPIDRSVAVNITGDTDQFVDAMSRLAIETMLAGCRVCTHYVDRRIPVLTSEVIRRAEARHEPPAAFLARYVERVHARHLAGESLSTRPFTEHEPTDTGGVRLHVKRICNGCGNNLGDVTADELSDAEAGRMLSDTRLECGCWTAAAA